MSDYLACITNAVPDLVSCTVRDQHRPSCIGVTRAPGRQMRECHGCVPRPATNGMLCDSDWLRLVDADENVVDLMTHMHSLPLGGGQTDNAGVRSAVLGYWPLASGPVAADALYEDMVMLTLAVCGDWDEKVPAGLTKAPVRGFPSTMPTSLIARKTDDLRAFIAEREHRLVTKHRGAEWAVRFARSFSAKSQQFPLHESDHRVPFVRCRECQRVRLSWTPPRYFADEVRVVCEHCGHVESQSMVEFDIRLIRDQQKGRS